MEDSFLALGWSFLSSHIKVQSPDTGSTGQRLSLFHKLQIYRGPNLSFGFGIATKATVIWKLFHEAIAEWCILHFATLLCTKIFWMTFSDSSGRSDLYNRTNTKASARDFSGTWQNFQNSLFVIWLPRVLFHLGCPYLSPPIAQPFFCLEGWLRTMGNSTGILLLKQQWTGTTSSSYDLCLGAQIGREY